MESGRGAPKDNQDGASRVCDGMDVGQQNCRALPGLEHWARTFISPASIGLSSASGLPHLPAHFLSLSPLRAMTRPSFKAGLLGSQA